MAHPLRSALDVLAGAILGGAVCFALVSIFHLPLLLAGSAGAIVLVCVFTSLHRDPAAPAAFVPLPLEFVEEPDELLLDQPIAADAPGPRVVRLFGPMPTPGEMHESIERHLGGRWRGADATEELREALAQLRRAAR